MSGFDNAMRTDQHIAQNRQFYDAQRYQSDRVAAQAIADIPAQMQQTQMNQQAMEQQQLQGALMEKQVMSDLRMQEATMEQQFHRNKMDQILMMDQVAMSHENRRGAKLQNDHAEFAFKEKQRAVSTESETSQSKTLDGMINNPHIQAAGVSRLFKKIPVLSNGVWSLRDASDDELKQFQKENQRRDDGAGPRYEADGARRMAESIAAPFKNKFTGQIEWPGTPEGRDAKARYDRLMGGAGDYYDSLYGGQGQPGAAPPAGAPGPGGGGPDGGQPTPQGVGFLPNTSIQDMMPPPGSEIPSPSAPLAAPAEPRYADDAPTLSQAAMQQANAGYMHAQRDPEWGSFAQEMGEEPFARLLTGVGVAAEKMVAAGWMPADRASQVVMQGIMRGGAEAAYYLTMSGMPDANIRAWLKNRGETDSAIKAIMSRIDAHASKLREKKK